MDNSLIGGMLYPLHPKLVHFPIALVISAMGTQALGVLLKKDSLCKGAWLMFLLAALSMPIVILSGLLEADRLHLHHPVLNAHKIFAFWAAGIAWVVLPFLWFIRHKSIQSFQIIFFIVLLSISVLLGLAAHQGGRMVYEYGVGVSQ